MGKATAKISPREALRFQRSCSEPTGPLEKQCRSQRKLGSHLRYRNLHPAPTFSFPWPCVVEKLRYSRKFLLFGLTTLESIITGSKIQCKLFLVNKFLKMTFFHQKTPLFIERPIYEVYRRSLNSL